MARKKSTASSKTKKKKPASTARPKKRSTSTKTPAKRKTPPRKSPPKKKPPARRKKKQAGRKKLMRLGSLGMIWAAIIGLLLMAYYLHDLPSTEILTEATRPYTIKVMSADGQLITTLGSTYGEELQYDDIPQKLIDAIIATEDRRFFEHFGLDLYGLARAMAANIKAGRIVQGGSTITQQLAKIVFLSPERTLKRKVQEAILAIWLEQRFTKEQILTMYVNRVYLGSGYFGVAAAAQGYFDKMPKDMTLSEAALFAGLLKAPTRYSPFNDLERAKKRAKQVLLNMEDAGLIPAYMADIQEIQLRTRPSRAGSRHYFIDWITSQIPDYIGIIDDDIIITTTLDMKLQVYAEDAINQHLSKFGKKRKAGQAAVFALSPKGQILAMVGGKDYHRSQFNRVTQARRQPGSAFKYFVYLAALEAGLRPEDKFIDAPITVEGWEPRNYYEEFEGQMTLQDAFAKSVNTIAVQVSEQIGRDKVMLAARRLGITTNMLAVPSLALGTHEVSLFELTQAYAHMANSGRRVRAFGIKQIKTKDGRVLYQRRNISGSRVVSKSIVAQMNRLMKAVMEDEGTGRHVKLRRETAGKTGTTQNFRDAWFVGYTPQVIAGVWVGNDDNSPMVEVTGSFLAGRIWQSFMTPTHMKIKPRNLPIHSSGWFGFFEDWQDDRDTFWDTLLNDLERQDYNAEIQRDYPGIKKR